VVRVQNEVAGFAIGGLASEACGGGAQQLLAQIAGEL
jgi:outer membrane lipoprotein SlyB